MVEVENSKKIKITRFIRERAVTADKLIRKLRKKTGKEKNRTDIVELLLWSRDRWMRF